MSRAFVRESDDRLEFPIAPQPSVLPPGAKNYITADGAERLRDQLRSLVEVERPALAANVDNPEVKRQLMMLDRRIQQLEHSLQSAEVVQPSPEPFDAVRFGALVTVRRASGEQDEYRIVGVDEVDLDRGWVSWLSPIAKALLNSRVGQRVTFRFPSGEEQLEIVRISYDLG